MVQQDRSHDPDSRLGEDFFALELETPASLYRLAGHAFQTAFHLVSALCALATGPPRTAQYCQVVQNFADARVQTRMERIRGG